MGLYSPVNSLPQTLQAVERRRYPNRAILVFSPEDAAFEAAFLTSATVTNSKGVVIDTGGLVKELTINDFRGYLDAAGAPATEPIRVALEAHFSQRSYPDAFGIRASITKPDKVYIGRRTSSAVTSFVYTVTGNLDGVYVLRIGLFGLGEVREFKFTASGNTVTEIRDGLIALAIADTDVTAVFSIAANGVDAIDIDTINDGVPGTVSGTSTGSPVTVVEDTAAGTWSTDYDALVQAAEIDGAMERLWYWVHDIQCTDVVNLAAALHIKNLADAGVTPVPRKYRYMAQSHDPLNFDPLSAGAAFVEQMLAAGYDRSNTIHKALPEFAASAWMGRCIGYLPGAVGFANMELFGDTEPGEMTPEDYGANEGLADTRRFTWYASVAPDGLTTKPYVPAAGRWVETGWKEDYYELLFNEGVRDLLALRNITTYTNADISAIRKAGEDAISGLPNVLSVEATVVPREATPDIDIQLRVYLGLALRINVGGQIIQVGTLANPVPLIISEF